MRKNKSQTGSAQIVIVIVVVAALVGTLGFVFWNNFLNKKADVAQTNATKAKVEESCAGTQNTAAEKGVFCSEELGVKVTVPSIFTNKLVKAANYEVFKNPTLNPDSKQSAGMSENVYSAAISGNDNFTFTIAQEPLRTGYVGVSHMLQNTYYDQADATLTLVKSPTRHYDSATGTYTTTGSYSKGEVVPSFTADGVRFFKGTVGDAGQTENTYFGVVKGKIIKISLKHTGYMGDPSHDPSTINADNVFAELDTAVKALKVVAP
jgi:hypothetical protein